MNSVKNTKKRNSLLCGFSRVLVLGNARELLSAIQRSAQITIYLKIYTRKVVFGISLILGIVVIAV